MKSLLTILFLLMASHTFAEPENYGTDYQTAWCAQKEGIDKYRLPGSYRVDCLTDSYAIEFDVAEKWALALGQARYSANMTGRQPGVGLIMKDKQKGFKYLLRLLKAIEDDPKHWRVWIVEPGDLQ